MKLLTLALAISATLNVVQGIHSNQVISDYESLDTEYEMAMQEARDYIEILQIETEEV